MSAPFCVNCKWYMDEANLPEVARCYVSGYVDVVSGQRKYHLCSMERATVYGGMCGPEAKNFEMNVGEQPQGYEDQEEVQNG